MVYFLHQRPSRKVKHELSNRLRSIMTLNVLKPQCFKIQRKLDFDDCQTTRKLRGNFQKESQSTTRRVNECVDSSWGHFGALYVNCDLIEIWTVVQLGTCVADDLFSTHWHHMSMQTSWFSLPDVAEVYLTLLGCCEWWYVGAWSNRRDLNPKFYKLTRPWSLWRFSSTREISYGRTGNRARDLMSSCQVLTTKPRG
jgi:hypothetical protein